MDLTTFNLLTYSWLAIALITFIALFRITAPFGRHTSDNFGPTIDNRWAWFIMEIVSPLVLLLFFISGSKSPNAVTWLIVGLWSGHYFNRSFIYPWRQKDTSKRMPVAIMLSGVAFNCVNGFLNGYYLGNLSPDYELSWFWSPQFITGISLFFGGMFINWQSDNILLNLRKPGEKGYKIPYGGFFRWVSCPNLFGEVIEWIGFAILVFNLPALSFALWTFANLVPRALAHHKWYHQKFKDYPKERKAVLPHLL